MKKTLVLIIFALLLNCKSTVNLTYSESLAKMLIEVGDQNQINSLAEKIKRYDAKPETVFNGDEYYYDTENQKHQAVRGSSEDLKKNVYWFLLIDNLSLGKYLWEIDWKESEDEILAIVKLLAAKKGYYLPEIPVVPKESKLDTGGKLSFYNKKLKESEFILVNLYIDSDSYVTTIIKEKNLTKLKAKAAESGNKINKY